MNQTLKRMKKSNSFLYLTPHQIFDIESKKEKGGIEGYRCPKKYFDYNEVLWLRKRENILKRHRAVWPPEDWKSSPDTGKKVPPRKYNFIDERIKWANSFNDIKKSQEIKDALEAKGKIIEDFKPFKSDFEKKVNKKNLGLELKNHEEKLKKITEQINLIPQHKQNAIEQVIEKMKNNARIHKPFTGKSNWGKSERIMYNSESEYLGEQVPFWNNYSKEEDKKKSEFYPLRIKFLRRSPSWSFGPAKKDDKTKETVSEYIKARDERLEEKANSVFEKMGIDKKKYQVNAVESFNKVINHGMLPILFRKPFNFKETEQYKSAMENRSFESPAPNLYWDDGKSRIKLRKDVDEDDAKRWVMTRDKTYRSIYTYGLKKGVF
jgi:antitoxin component of RelBE/YafQ-DinJ toxin-antitoxin module